MRESSTCLARFTYFLGGSDSKFVSLDKQTIDVNRRSIVLANSATYHIHRLCIVYVLKGKGVNSFVCHDSWFASTYHVCRLVVSDLRIIISHRSTDASDCCFAHRLRSRADIGGSLDVRGVVYVPCKG